MIRPLYGMPESPIHWFTTYMDHNVTSSGMHQMQMDPCLFYKQNDADLSGLLALQVDDTLYDGTELFEGQEEIASQQFPWKGQRKVTDKALKFNGVEIKRTTSGFSMVQSSYLSESQTMKRKERPTFEEFRSGRAKMAYASFSTVPKALVNLAKLAQFTSERYATESTEVLRILRKCEKEMHSNLDHAGPCFTKIPPGLIEVVVLIDPAFALNYDKSSQLGILVAIRNKTDRGINILHFSSTKSKRVCKSVLAAELFALVDGFDIVYTITDGLERLLLRKVDLTIYTDSQSLYGLCISLSQTTEHRLHINLALIREAYERRDITKVVWIAGHLNPADGLTKTDRRCGVLPELLATNMFLPKARA